MTLLCEQKRVSHTESQSKQGYFRIARYPSGIAGSILGVTSQTLTSGPE
jgi:hypothetical protein